jgi:methylated-DNA-[protein]-cysteine S-methyltransferase
VVSEECAYQTIPSSFGDLALVWIGGQGGAKVWEILLPPKAASPELLSLPRRPQPDLASLAHRIERYLSGEDVQLPMDLLYQARCSPFQWSVLMAEKAVPRGFVTSYSRLASRVGRPRGYRAVGTALAHNPFPLVIPCHRTVRAGGSLGGFGGGLPMKRSLLEMEGVGFDTRGRVRPEFFRNWAAER